MGDFGEG
jgi:hypothetical protein